MTTLKALLAGAVALAATPSMALTVVTFDSLAAPTYLATGASVTDNGYTFTSDQDAYSYLWDGSSPNSNGTNNLIASGFFGVGPAFTITKVGGGSFKLISFDLAVSWYSGASNASMTAGSATVNYTPTLTTYVVNQTGSSVTLSNGPIDGYWSADNFVFGAVPEPTTWALMIAGFGMVGYAMRRRTAALAA